MHSNRLIVAALPLALLLAGCGGHDKSSRNSSASASTSGPRVVSVVPDQGPDVGTNTVLIEVADFSRGFDPANDQVTIGGAAVTSLSAPTGTTIQGVAPVGSAGAADIVVTLGGETATLAGGYTYRVAEVTAITPNSGAAGLVVTVQANWFAADFLTATPQVSFGGVPATSVSALSGNTVQATVPAGSGSVDVTLTSANPAQSAVLAGGFTYGAGSGGGGGTVPGPAGATANDLIVENGANNPGLLNSRAPNAGVVVGQVRLRSGIDVTLNQFAVSGNGTVDESAGLGDVVLYKDTNGNGRRDAGEPQLGQGTGFSANGGTITFTGLNEAITPAAPVDVLIAVEVDANANIGDVITFRCESANLRAVQTGTTTAVRVIGGAQSGSLQVVGTNPPKTFNVAPAPNNPGPASVAANAANVPVLALRCTTTTGIIDLHTVEFQTSGSGHDARDVLSARLGRDANANGRLDASETIIGTATPGYDNGRIRFNFHGQRLSSASSTYDLVLEYTLSGTATANTTFDVSLVQGGVFAHAYYDNGGQQITLTPARISNTVTVNAASSALTVRAVNTPARVVNGGNETQAMRLSLRAGSGNVTVTRVTVHARGDVNDATEVSGVSLYGDTNGNGVFDAATDQRLAGPSTFTANDGSVAFTVNETVTGGASSNLFVTATLSAGVASGKSFALSLTPATDVSASQTPAAGDVQQGTLFVVGSGQVAFVQPDPAEGKDAYLRGEGLYLNDNFGHSNGLAVGDRPSGQLGERLSYIQFPLPTLPAAATPRKVYVALYLASTNGLVAPFLDVQTFRVVPSGNRTPWVEGRGGFDASVDGICFNGVSQATTRSDVTHPNVATGVVREVRINSGTAGRWVLFDVTATAQAWYAGTSPNLGLRFRDKDFATHNDGSVTFYSSDTPRATLRPILIVEH